MGEGRIIRSKLRHSVVGMYVNDFMYRLLISYLSTCYKDQVSNSHGLVSFSRDAGTIICIIKLYFAAVKDDQAKVVLSIALSKFSPRSHLLFVVFVTRIQIHVIMLYEYIQI